MRQNSHYILLILCLYLAACTSSQEDSPDNSGNDELSVSSPNSQIQIDFFLTNAEEAAYRVLYKEQIVIDTSKLGFTFKDFKIAQGLEIIGIANDAKNETWEMPWGEQRIVKNQYNELKVSLQQKEGTQFKFEVLFRAFNDGLGFRYALPEQDGLGEIIIMDENTEFNLTADHTCWWIPGDWDIYEHLYNTSKFSEIDALSKRDHPNLAQTTIPENAVNTPVTMKSDNGVYLSFHEANLTDYAGMTLKIDPDNLLMTSELVGSDREGGRKVKRQLPFHTPWRTIQITDRAGALIESNLIVNLNEPSVMEDISWFKPKKYVGIWWEMHLGKSSWDKASGQHGATTENAKRYIDFAADNGFTGLLVEGWNTGWEQWLDPTQVREGIFDFVTPYDDYDLEEVARYAKEKDVELIMHHETSAAPRTYEKQLDAAFGLMQGLGIHAVKTGYVGKIIPEGEYHHGQWMVNHYRKVLETGAKYQVAINAHEPIKATGIRRTYPNAISREGLRGQEFNAWSNEGGNSTEHLTIVPFTRMLAGPIDYTPGIFNLTFEGYKDENQVKATLAHELALYVVIYSPVQMVADLPQHYEGNPALQFIRDVGVDWEQSRVLDGEVGDFLIMARQERDSDKWFVGGLTDENERAVNFNLDFLEEGKKYVLSIYKDAEDAHWQSNPTACTIEKVLADNTTEINLKLAPGGGFALSLIPASEEEQAELQASTQ